MARKETRQFLHKLTGAGVRIEHRRNGHLRAILPNGRVVFLSATPSDHRAFARIRRDIRHNGLEV